MIQIKYAGKTLTSDQLHKIGWAIIDAGKTQDRYAIQLAQSKADPTNEKERDQADRAASNALRAARKVSRILEGFRQ
jgi:hypothetical protein